MIIEYIYSTEMIVNFDHTFNVYFKGTLDEATAEIISFINLYGFSTADIISKETGEILVHIEDN